MTASSAPASVEGPTDSKNSGRTGLPLTNAFAPKKRLRRFERHRRRPDERREQPVGQSGHGVLLEQHRRHAAQRGHQHDRPRAVAADADHQVRTARATRRRHASTRPRAAAATPRAPAPAIDLPLRPPLRIRSSANPSRGTTRASMPCAVPANEICVSGPPRQQLARDGDARDTGVRRSRRRQSRPATPTTGRPSCRRCVLRHVQQNAHAEQVDQQRRPAGADERQRNALRRQQPEHDADVERTPARRPSSSGRARETRRTCRARAARRAAPRHVMTQKQSSTAVAPMSPSSSEITE